MINLDERRMRSSSKNYNWLVSYCLSTVVFVASSCFVSVGSEPFLLYSYGFKVTVTDDLCVAGCFWSITLISCVVLSWMRCWNVSACIFQELVIWIRFLGELILILFEQILRLVVLMFMQVKPRPLTSTKWYHWALSHPHAGCGFTASVGTANSTSASRRAGVPLHIQINKWASSPSTEWLHAQGFLSGSLYTNSQTSRDMRGFAAPNRQQLCH